MAILSPAQAKQLGVPNGPPNPLPKPPAPNVVIVNPDGTPTAEFHRYLTQHDLWMRRLIAVLTT